MAEGRRKKVCGRCQIWRMGDEYRGMQEWRRDKIEWRAPSVLLSGFARPQMSTSGGRFTALGRKSPGPPPVSISTATPEGGGGYRNLPLPNSLFPFTLRRKPRTVPLVNLRRPQQPFPLARIFRKPEAVGRSADPKNRTFFVISHSAWRHLRVQRTQ